MPYVEPSGGPASANGVPSESRQITQRSPGWTISPPRLLDPRDGGAKVGDRDVGEREAVAGPRAALVHPDSDAGVLPLPAAALAGNARLERRAEQPLPEAARPLWLVGRELDQDAIHSDTVTRFDHAEYEAPAGATVERVASDGSPRTMSCTLIVAFHAASGAAAGSVTKSRLVALASGPVLHVAADRVPHRHPRHAVWEYATGLATLGLLARRRGLLDAATIGAVAAVAPDLEHLVPRRLSRGRVFHKRRGADRRRPHGLSVAAQLALSAALLLPVLRRPT